MKYFQIEYTNKYLEESIETYKNINKIYFEINLLKAVEFVETYQFLIGMPGQMFYVHAKLKNIYIDF